MGRSGVGGGSSRGGGGGGGRGSMGRSSGSGRSGVSRGPSHSSSYRSHSFYSSPVYRTRRPHYGYGPGYGGPPHSYAGGRLINSVIAVMVLIIVFVAAWNSVGLGGGQITASTVNREPLPAGSVQETAYYTDNLFWFGNDTALLNGMKDYYKQTGVQPYLYITDQVDGSRDPSAAQMEQFANELYDELFTDEAHLLLVFQDADGHYTDWVITGSQAKQVIDTEAVNILLDYVDRYYYDSSLSESQLFGKAFSKAADRTMSKTTSPLVYVAGAGVIIVVVVAGVYVFRKKQEQKKREDEQMERILNMDLSGDDVGQSPEVEGLEKKYENKETGGN